MACWAPPQHQHSCSSSSRRGSVPATSRPKMWVQLHDNFSRCYVTCWPRVPPISYLVDSWWWETSFVSLWDWCRDTWWGGLQVAETGSSYSQLKSKWERPWQSLISTLNFDLWFLLIPEIAQSLSRGQSLRTNLSLVQSSRLLLLSIFPFIANS